MSVVYVFIQIYAPLHLCLERIKSRDGTKHIKISEEKIVKINSLSVNQHVDSKLRIDTSEMSDEEILQQFRAVYDK